MKRWLVGCAMAGLVAAPAAQAQDVAVFQPNGGWIADYGEDYCRLARTFSNGKEEVNLALERTQPGAPVRIILVGDGIKTFRGADQIGYALQPAGPSAKTRYVRSETAEKKQFLSLDPITLATPTFTPGAPPRYDREAELGSARGISTIALDEGLTSPVRIETGSLRAPIAAMQACADDLLKVWGLDPEKHKTMKSAATLKPDPNGVLPQGTIPFGEFGKLGGGANQVRLLISAEGKPTSCTIYSPSLADALNKRICSLVMEKAAFEPARDAEDQPMASYWMGSPMFLGPPFPGRR